MNEALPTRTYEITFYRKDGGTEMQQYTHFPEAREAFELFREPDSKELYDRIILSEYNWNMKEERIYWVLDFGKRDLEHDWHKWKVGRYTRYRWKEFDGSGEMYGLITEVHDDHAIMEAEGQQLWIDDPFSDMFD